MCMDLLMPKAPTIPVAPPAPPPPSVAPEVLPAEIGGGSSKVTTGRRVGKRRLQIPLGAPTGGTGGVQTGGY